MANLFIDQPNLEAQLGEFLKMTSQTLEEMQSNPLQTRRKEALAHFQNLGFPNTKHEEWKYTNVKPLINKAYAFGNPSDIQASDVQAVAIPSLEANVLVMENGKFRKDLSTILDTEEVLVVKDLQMANQEHPELLETYYSQKLNLKNEAFTALNTLMAENGLFIHIPKGKVLQHPIALYYISDARKQDIFIPPRVLILVGENAEGSLIDTLSTLGDQASFNNAITEIQVANDARFNHYKIQNDQPHTYFIGTTQVHQGDNSLYHNVTLSLNGALVRNNLNILLDGQNIESNMYGLYMLEGKTLVDNHSIADHMKPHSVSNELYKGIMDGQSKGVFNGKIFVRQDAQKTNAYQQNRNILMTDQASINTKPQLEIWADDVKCSHGATTGSLDEQALFYLRSRGISKDEARALLLHAFAYEIIEKVKISLIQDHLEGLVLNRLRKRSEG